MNTKELNSPLQELRLNRSVPENLLKSGDKEEVTFGNSHRVISRKHLFIIAPVNYNKK